MGILFLQLQYKHIGRVFERIESSKTDITADYTHGPKLKFQVGLFILS